MEIDILFNSKGLGMLIGVPRELKDREDRVGLIPSSVRELVDAGHKVWIQASAGVGAGIVDREYVQAGSEIIDDSDTIWANSELIVKVKEPLASERRKLRSGQVLFTYLHLAPDPGQANDLMHSSATCIAYETVTSPTGALPLLTPMSEVAGRMAIQVGAHCLENAQEGRGILLGGVPGVAPAKVLILGGGVAGTNAALMALGAGADVTVVDRSGDVLRRLIAQFGTAIKAIFPSAAALANLVADADLVVGTVLVPGASAPKLVTRKMLGTMKKGSVIVDVAIDQGGCTETSRPTTHSEPTYIVDGVIHYCVANMPGGVARTSTFALNNVTLPYIQAIANMGWRGALRDDPHLRNGLSVHAGHITNPAVAAALGYKATSPEDVVAV